MAAAASAAAAGADSAEAAAPACRQRHDDLGMASSALDSMDWEGDLRPQPSADSSAADPNAASTAAPASAGAASLLVAAASALLLHRRHAPVASRYLPSATGSGVSAAVSTAVISNTHSSSRCSSASSILLAAWPDRNLDRSNSHSSSFWQQQQGSSGGGDVIGGGQGTRALQHKGSDSLLDTCRVLASVPQETITSTRQVLAAFNYDYSALRRRESTYVSGPSGWRGSMSS